MAITQLDPTNTASLEAWYDMLIATERHDVPDFPTTSRQRHMARFTHPFPGAPEEVFLAWDGDRVVGSATAMLTTLDNIGTLYLEMRVHPDFRRRGIAKALLQEMYALARRNDRRIIEVTTVAALDGGPERDEAGLAFALTLGDKPALNNVRRRWTVETADTEVIAPVAPGYSLVSWVDHAPDDMLEGVAALEGRLMLDMPTGDLDIEPQKMDVERVRNNEDTRVGRGERSYHLAARHDASGTVAAYTMISMEAGIDHHAWQQITIVDPQHRGHRLGLATKIANHAYVLEREPALREIDTWNAESNSHMIAVNEAMGYRKVDLWQVWQFPVPAAD